MTRFEELQQTHQRLLDRMDEVADKDAFVREVQAYVTRVRDEAVDVPAPRDRDQLRAILRFWASYIYDATGTYPNTNLRPARMEAAPMPTPPSTGSRLPIAWGIAALAALVIIIAVIFTFSTVRSSPPDIVATHASGQAAVAATLTKEAISIMTPTPAETTTPTLTPTPSLTATPSGSGRLTIDWSIVTQGPSPFDPNVWAARIELSAQGGNGAYIYWVDGQRLPEVSASVFTVEGQGCEAKRAEVGVTSDGQAVSQPLEIKSPLSQCP